MTRFAPGARVLWRNDPTFTGTLTDAPPEWPGYIVVIWDNYPRSILPAHILGQSLHAEGQACTWCWGDLDNVAYSVLGQDFCDPTCHGLYQSVLRAAIARRMVDDQR